MIPPILHMGKLLHVLPLASSRAGIQAQVALSGFPTLIILLSCLEVSHPWGNERLHLLHR
jgi:hypothetical protein